MVSIHTSSSDRALARVGERLRVERHALAGRWHDRFSELLIDSGQPVEHQSSADDTGADYIDAIAGWLAGEPAAAGDAWAPARLGELRFRQHVPIGSVRDEHAALGDVLHEFVEAEAAAISPPLDVPAARRLLLRVRAAVRAAERIALEHFVARYVDTIEAQTSQLRRFHRLVSREIRQPLDVLKVLARTLTVSAGDLEAVRMMEILDRSVARLTDVTWRLERDAAVSAATDLKLTERRVDLSAVAADVAHRLDPLAGTHGVAVRVEENLPSLRLDQWQAELVFLNLIANGIKHFDQAKARRVVEVVAASQAEAPAVVVRDNGIGIAPGRLRQIFRDLRGQGPLDAQPAGLGFGLTIVRACMDASRGSVRIESQQGHGTTVTLTWPNALRPAR